MNDQQLAARVGELVGGPDNVNQVHTCATRLRFVVRDKNNVQRDELNKTKGVIQLVEQGGQTQVVIGPNVGDVYTALTRLPGWTKFGGDQASAAGEKVGVINRIFDSARGHLPTPAVAADRRLHDQDAAGTGRPVRLV